MMLQVGVAAVGAALLAAVSPAQAGVSPDPDFDFVARPFGNDDFLFHFSVLEEEGCLVKTKTVVTGDRWLAFGLGTQMSGSRAIIAEGADTVDEFTLSSRLQSSIVAAAGASGIEGTPVWLPGNGGESVLLANLTSIAGAALNTGCIEADDGSRDSRRRVLQTADAVDRMVWAYGSSNTFDVHAARAASTLDWETGEAAGALIRLNSADQLKLELHGALMSLAFGLLAPLAVGAAISKLGSADDTIWFGFHRALIGIALVVSIAGLVLIVLLVDDHVSELHHYVGVAVMALFVLNPVIGLLRPHKQHARRPAWHIVHRVAGYGAVLGGLANIVLGAKEVEDFEAYFAEDSVVAGAAIAGFGLLIILAGAVYKLCFGSKSTVGDTGAIAVSSRSGGPSRRSL